MNPLLSAILFLSAAVFAAIPGELAHYTLAEGKGTALHEAQGRLPDLVPKGSFWVPQSNGLTLLDFGGMKNSRGAHITLPPIPLEGAFSIAIWVRGYWWKNNWAPIVYRSDATFGLRNNATNPGQLHFLVHQQGVRRATHLFSKRILDQRRWYHVAATFEPGKAMRIYIDGELDAELTHKVPTAYPKEDSPFFLGSKNGRGDAFAGLLYNLHIYNRALAPAEVAALFKDEDRFHENHTEVLPAPGKTAAAISIGGTAVSAFAAGGLQIQSRGQSYLLHSFYSYPARPRFRQNALAASPIGEAEPQWRVEVRRQGERALLITARGTQYAITRTVTLESPVKIRVSDRIENLTDTDQGIILRHAVEPLQPVTHWSLHGLEQGTSSNDARLAPMNPTGFLACARGSLGWAVEDDILRCHLHARTIPRPGNRAFQHFGSTHIGFPARKSHTLEFTLHLAESTDYFDFLNTLRRDWKVPVITLNGPFISLRTAAQRSETYRRLVANPDEFRALLKKRNMRIITLSPWLGGWDADAFPTRSALEAHLRQALATIRSIDPSLKLLGATSTYIHSFHEDDFNTPAPPGFSWEKLTPAVSQRLLASPWKDSLLTTPQGEVVLYPLSTVPGRVRPAVTARVFPAIGNHFHKLRMKAIDYTLDDLGYDGLYFDMFGFASATLHSRWDGFSVAIAPDGTIDRKYTHLGPYTAPARAQWLRRILGKGKIALTNFGAPTTRELQTIPYYNFCEAAGNGVGHQDLDSIPPDSSGCAMNQLSCPLGYGPHRAEEIHAPRLMARVRAYLRYGCLYVHTSVRNQFPDDGPTGGSYEAINHCFPITPVELHRGWVKGRERIVSCVSYATAWDRAEKPVALRFDAVGRPVPAGDAAVIKGAPGKWQITVKIDDWKEFLILE